MHLTHLRVLLLAVFVSGGNGDRRSKFLEELLKIHAVDDSVEISEAEVVKEFDDDENVGFDWELLVALFKSQAKNDNVRLSKAKAIEEVHEDQYDDANSQEVAVAELERLIQVYFVSQATAAEHRGDTKAMQKLDNVLRSLFAMLDADADDHVTPAELFGGCYNIFALYDYRGSEKSPRELCGMAAEVCAHFQSDANPLRLADEDRLAKVAFEFQDENGDGQITAEEQANTQFAAGVYLNRDYPLDGKVTPKQMCEAAAGSATPAGVEYRFRIMDANKNGAVSAKEYKAYASAYYVV